jgi:predicted enzyme related to lactoylglutathione lyase
MPEVANYASGTPSWADLLSHDGQGAKDFYTGLFGWECEDNPVDENMVYTMYTHRGIPACASVVAYPGSEQEDLPAHWSVYITVDDLEGTTERARAAGGVVIAEPFDVFDVGRMSIIQDPQGAFLRLWFPIKHVGAGVTNEPGALSWFELTTTDLQAAREFYAQVLQVEAKPDPDAPFPHTLLKVGDQPVAGIIEIGEDWGDVPPHWSIYFGVSDVDATVARVQELGGTVIVEPRDIKIARFAVATDAEGAVFSLLQMHNW